MLRHFVPSKTFCLKQSSFKAQCSRLRLLSTKDSEGKDGSSKAESKSKSKSVIIKYKQKTKQLKPEDKIKISEKLEQLKNDAKAIKSIGPNDKNTLSQKIGKPKVFIRQSARDTVDSVPKENVETIDVLAQGLDKRLVQAAKRVASKMPKHLAKETEKKLLDSIKKQKNETIEEKKKLMADRKMVKEDFTKSISYQIMKENNKSGIDEYPVGSVVTRIKYPENFSDNSLNEARFVQKSRFRKSTSLFTGECLNIFDPKGLFLSNDINCNLFWEKLMRKETELSVNFPSENSFEEMIKWTEEGKLWRYPINNEQGLESEEEVPFYEHVLLDSFLKDFPDKGPIRYFMELIIMGLSQNPYITVERKHETINFYKKFFDEHNLTNIYSEENDNVSSEL